MTGNTPKRSSDYRRRSSRYVHSWGHSECLHNNGQAEKSLALFGNRCRDLCLAISVLSNDWATRLSRGSNGCTVHPFFCKLIYLCEFRHRKQRGEVMITVDSCETVRDVKLELMKLFSVMPLDQHLSIDGKVLEDGEILGAAGVRPGSILLLKVSRNVLIGGFQTFPGDCNRAFFNIYTGGAKAPPPSPYVAPLPMLLPLPMLPPPPPREIVQRGDSPVIPRDYEILRNSGEIVQ